MLKITNNAKEQIKKLMLEENLDNAILRIGVKGGGCAGFSYTLEFDSKTNENDEIFDDNGIQIACDKSSFLYLFGTELDFSGGLNGKGFEWNNPNANRTCSCGTSFGV